MTFIALVPPIYYNVKQYGALGDGKTVTDGAITTGTPTLTSATAAFTSADAGKQITVNGAGTSAANLNTTISAYVNATTVTLTTNASTTVSAATVFYGTDDTTAISNARSAANTAGGGIIYYPYGTYITGAQTIYNNVIEVGAGSGSTIIKLKSGTNADLFSANTSSISLSASYGASSTGGVSLFGFRDLTLDGNKTNQTSGTSYPLRVYGYGYGMQNVIVRNGYTGGILADWNGGDTLPSVNGVSAVFNTVKIHDNNGVGLQIGGPHDSIWENVESFNNGTHNLHVAPNARNMHFTNCRFFNPGTGVTALCCLLEANKTYFNNCEAGNSDNLNVAVLGNDITWIGGNIYSNPAANIVGVQFGQNSGLTPFSSSLNTSAGLTTSVQTDACFFETSIYDCQSGAIAETNTLRNIMICRVHQSSGNALATNGGYPVGRAAAWVVVTGLTPDGSPGKGGFFSAGRLAASPAWQFLDTSGNTLIGLDTINGIFEVSNGHNMTGYSDDGTTQTFKLNAANGVATFSGNLSAGQSATAAVITSTGTITTAAIGEARIAPTAAVTGLIMQAGTIAGQMVTVVNESAFPATFAASGTSNVADGVANIIAPIGQRTYVWDSSTSLWYGQSTAPIQSTTAVVTAGSGTIATAGLDVSRVAPTAAVTAIVLAAGTYAGQSIIVVNEATTTTFSVTFAASGTSNVASGVAEIIPGLSSRRFVWDSGTSLWYSTASVPMQSATAVSTATSGTIATAGLDVSRVTTSGAVTGVILAAGTYAGQRVTVVNESANTITFATSGTSHVADGATAALNANAARQFVYDTGTSLWYRCV